MKRSPIKKKGKRTGLNQKANRQLKSLYIKNDVTRCEIGLPGCFSYTFLQFVHRHKRRWYYDKPDELLWAWEQTLLGCQSCHNLIEYDSKLTEKTFLKLRGPEELDIPA